MIAFERAQGLRGGEGRRLRSVSSLSSGTGEEYAEERGDFDEHHGQYDDQQDQRLILRPLFDVLEATLNKSSKRTSQTNTAKQSACDGTTKQLKTRDPCDVIATLW